ncbi:hypothetical protein HK104_006560 [Borealophlyctis nickersoniae]|nr:hypothetical protein HK104_006560 [Borealophlyctis nickersoniae]
MGKNAYEHHVSGLTMIHSVLRNGLESAIKHAATVQPPQLPSFLGYLDAYYINLHEHHDHEEEYIFPVLAPKFPSITEFESDHAHLVTLMQKLKDICEPNDGKGGYDIVKRKYDPDATVQVLKELQTFMVPHLAKEEEVVTVESLKANFTEKEIAEVDEKLGKVLKQHDPTIMLPFLYYNMTAELKTSFWDDFFPWILRWVLFPLIFARKHVDWWAFAMFPPQ